MFQDSMVLYWVCMYIVNLPLLAYNSRVCYNVVHIVLLYNEAIILIIIRNDTVLHRSQIKNVL